MGYFLVAMVIPLLPAIVWVFREVRNQTEAAKQKDNLRQYADDLWKDAMRGRSSVTEIERKSRELQDRIYQNRGNNPLVLDMFYKRLLPKNEAHMNRSAEELIAEALQSQGKNKKP